MGTISKGLITNYAKPVILVNEDGDAAELGTLDYSYELAAGIGSLATATGTTPITGVHGGSYIFDAQFAGTTPSLKLQVLGADGTTWRDVGTAMTAAGAQGVVIGSNATVRLYNAGANAITGLYANLT